MLDYNINFIVRLTFHLFTYLCLHSLGKIGASKQTIKIRKDQGFADRNLNTTQNVLGHDIYCSLFWVMLINLGL